MIFPIPKIVQDRFLAGYKLRQYGGKGLQAKTISEAKTAFTKGYFTLDKIKRMRAWFARHDAAGYKRTVNPPSPGYVAWLLWGGKEGKTWANMIMRRVGK